MAEVCPVSGEQVVLSLGPQTLMCSLKISKRQFFIVSLVRASFLFSRFQNFVDKLMERELALLFVCGLQGSYDMIYQDSILLESLESG